MVSKTRGKARKSAEAMREMLSPESDIEENHAISHNIGNTKHTLSDPTSTTRLESDDQFERLSQRVDAKINDGLNKSLTQFESRLEAALETVRQTVTTSLSARSQEIIDQKSEVDLDYRTTSASRIQQIADECNQGENVDLGPSHVRDNGQGTGPIWFGSQESLRERTTSETDLANSHMVAESGSNNPTAEQYRATFHMVKRVGSQWYK